ncbi:MAG: amidohydrolase [Myxococcota bacterium]
MTLTRRDAMALCGTLLAGCAAPRRLFFAAHAEELVARALDGLDRARLLDTHVHVVGVGAGGTGCYINEEMTSPLHPVKVAQLGFYATASGMWDLRDADEQYIRRLRQLARMSGLGRFMIIAFAQFHDENGRPRPEHTEFHTPNRYVLDLAQLGRDVFLPVISVHPYDPHALQLLDEGHARGAVAVKWLPNAMGIDPGSPRCDAFYARMRSLALPLITHAGEERAVDAADRQELGNPLRLRRPLEAGVKVIVAHCAGLGESLDLDEPERTRTRKRSFDLFLRLFTDPRHERLLFADISAMVQVNRSGAPLREILKREELHARLVNGSDYPLPAIGLVIRTEQLAARGYLEGGDVQVLNAIRDENPLLFDFVLKRRLRIRDGKRTFRLANSVFTAPPGLFPGG